MLSICTIKVSADHLAPAAQEFVYCVAGCELVFTQEINCLSGFFVAKRASSLNSLNAFKEYDHTQLKLCYHGAAPFAQLMRDVKFYRSAEMARIDVDDVPACLISLNTNHIKVINKQAYDSAINLELLTGPALILLLSQQALFCLHAGAVATPFGAIAIVAESGVGKSTLSADDNEQWGQLSDDILPLQVLANKQIVCRSDFPQLKLANAQASGFSNNNIPLHAIVRLNPKANNNTVFKRLNAIDALLQVTRHTVAAKLFNSQLLASHSSFAHTLSTTIPIFEVSYPRDLGQLSAVRAQILAHLKTHV